MMVEGIDFFAASTSWRDESIGGSMEPVRVEEWER
jgi:hypothetical protein